jgi:hypothetical protein
MGAAMVAGKVMGLDEEGLMRTISLATNYASGLVESAWQGDRQATRSGLFASVVARSALFNAAERSLDGNAGFYRGFGGSSTGKLTYAFTGPLQIDPAGITADLGKKYVMRTVMFRMYGVGAYNDPVIDLMVEMKKQHNIKAEDVDHVAVSMNWHETLYPSPEFPTDAEWNTPRVGSTHYYAAHGLVNGGYPAVGGKSYGAQGVKPSEDKKVIDFMTAHVTLVQEKDRPMFSPGAVVKMKDGTVHKGEYPYQRLEWTFDQLVPRLQECLPGIPGGKPALDRLVATMSGADRLTSVDGIYQVLKA